MKAGLSTINYQLSTSPRPYPITTFYAGFLAVFIIANLLVFQPWDWDNMKLLLWWFLGSIILVLHASAYVIGELKKTKPSLRIAAYCLLTTVYCSFISTGLLAARYETGKSVELFSAADRQLADFVRENTPSDAIFLTSERHNHPITTLAGRCIYLGYGGWLWSHGIDAKERTAQAKAMLSGEAGTLAILRAQGIGYIVLEPGLSGADPSFFDANTEKIFTNGSFTLYAVR